MTNWDAVAHYRHAASEGYAAYTEGRLDVEEATRKLRRHPGLDLLRGVAIAAMVVDHLAIVLDGDPLIRNTVGRLAMPLFFVLAGMVASRAPSDRRVLVILSLGLLVPLVVPWVDAPNVLVYYVAGHLWLALSRHARLPLWLLPALGLTLAANGFDWSSAWPGRVAFQVVPVLALMCMGSMLTRRVVPQWRFAPLEFLGRHALVIYVGHVLALEVLRRWVL